MTAVLPPRPTVGRPDAWRFPDATSTVLPSGLTLVLCPLPGKSLVSAQLLLDLPTGMDPAGLEGAAVLAAQTLDEGTEHRDAEAYADALETLGASFFAHAGHDGLRAGVQSPVRSLAPVLELLAEAVVSPAFPTSEVDRLRASRLDAIRQELANPATRARLAYRSIAYADGERARLPEGGSAETVAEIARDQVAALYACRADPRLATLVVAGDMSGADVPELVSRALGGWASPGADPTTAVAPGTVDGPRVLVVDKPGAVQTELLLGHPSVDRRDPAWSAMAAVCWALGGTLTSRIDALLREEKGYTYGMRMGMEPRHRGGAVTIHGSVDTPSTGPAVADLLGVLRTAVAGGFTDAERVATVDYLAGVTPLNYETPDAVAAHLMTARAVDLPPGWLDGHLARLRSLTTDQLSEASAAHLHPDELLVVAVGDASQIAGPLADAGLGRVEVV